DLGGDIDDDTLLYEIARRALGGPGEAGRSSYQVALTRCEECGQASIDAAGQSHPVDQAVAAMAACDSQQLGAVGGTGGGSGGRSSSPHVGADVAADDEACETEPEPPRPTSLSPHVGAEAAADTPRRRASQTIPPAIRRGVMRRGRSLRSRFGVPTCASRTSPLHGQRCSVPGCANHQFLDVHHVDPRAEGGSHDPERMLALCGSHHRSAHTGSLCIDGNATVGFTFRHADGASYGQPLKPAAVDRAQQAFSALRHLGFRSSHARALIKAAVQAGAPDDLEGFVRAALQAS
ncbi:MAG: hypothetical protein DRI90_27195, partial [Deltaproteobacteria bacterium]